MQVTNYLNMSNNWEKQLSMSRKIGFGTIYEAEFKTSTPHRRFMHTNKNTTIS